MIQKEGTREKRNILLHTIGISFLFFSQWLISSLLVRLGGFYNAGVFSLAMTISNIFAYFANFGIRTCFLTDADHKHDSSQYKSASIIAIGSSYIICTAYIFFAGHYSNVEIISILCFLTYNNFNSYSDVLFGEIQLSGHLEKNGVSNLIRGILCFSLFIISFLIYHNIVLSVGMMALASGIVLCFYDIVSYKKIVKKSAVRYSFSGRYGLIILRQCVPIMLMNTIPLITTAIPRDTIQRIHGTELLGIFSSIFTPTVLISIIMPAVIQGLLPKLSESWKYNLNLFIKQIFATVAIALGMTILFVLFVTIFGRPIMSFIFGEEILPYFYLLYWAALVTGMNAIIAIGNNLLVVMHANRILIISSCVSAVICLLLSYPLINQHQLMGGTYSLFTAYLVQIIFQSMAITYMIKGKNRGR